MLQFFLNPWLLAGLAGVTLPVIVHLLVRRRYHVVDWGAMQFLSPAVRTRRRLQLQDVVLLVLRMILIALLALALARPWIRGGLLTGYESAGSRDVVLIIDSSGSMSQPDGISTLHQSAIRRASRFLQTLSAEDTVMLIEARDEPNVLLPSPATDRTLVTERLNQLESPAGFGDLHAACERAASLLLQASHQHRDIVVLTDGQQAGWQTDRPSLWEQFDDLLTFTAVKPRLWVIDCSHQAAPAENLISLGRLTVDPAVIVPSGDVRVTATVTSHASIPLEVPVRLKIDGQRLTGQERQAQVAAGGEATIEFQYRAVASGLQELTVEADLPKDDLPVDNVSHAIAAIRPAPQLLLIESSDAVELSRQRTFFAATALTPPSEMSPWVEATVLRSDEVTEAEIAAADVIICPDVGRLPPDAPGWLEAAVRAGTGLLIAVGRHTTVDTFEQNFVASGLLPGVRLTNHVSADGDAGEPVQILASSLQADWLRPFAERQGTSFLQAVFRTWWDVRDSAAPGEESDQPAVTPLIRLTSQAPLLLERHHGAGHVLLLTTSLDTEWSNLPGRPDFVAFLYEAVFRLAPAMTRRNVTAGDVLIARRDPSEQAPLCVRRPAGDCEDVRGNLVRSTSSDTSEQLVRYDRADVPGIYRLLDQRTEERLDAFAVDYDRRENTVTRLSQADRDLLQSGERMVLTDSLTGLQRMMYGDEAVTELWWPLLWVFLLLLVVESWVTRRLVIQRHGVDGRIDEESVPVDDSRAHDARPADD